MVRAIAAFVLALAASVPAAHAKPVRILFVGNELLDEARVPARLASLAKAMGKDAQIESVTSRSYALADHWRDEATHAAIAKGWDFVVLQQGASVSGSERAALVEEAKRFAKEIRKSGAKPALFMAWPDDDHRREIPAAIASYRAAAEASDALLIPAAEGLLRVLSQQKSTAARDVERAASDIAVLCAWFALFPAGPQEFDEAYVAKAARELGIEGPRRDVDFDAATRAIDEPIPLK